MSHNYLLDLDEHIGARIILLAEEARAAASTSQVRRRTEGRLAALKGFQSLLHREYLPKLPKRLYRRMSKAACEATHPREPEKTPVTGRGV